MARYLVVDDSPTVRLTLAAAIRHVRPFGSEVMEASDRDAALMTFRKVSPDVVFLDMMLASGQKGLDVLREMLQLRADAKVVLVTGLPPEDPEVRSAIMEGAFAHLQKPIRSDLVRKVLNDIEEESGRYGRIR
ncbi:MAG: response regulator [Thermoplasmatota archaeon]